MEQLKPVYIKELRLKKVIKQATLTLLSARSSNYVDARVGLTDPRTIYHDFLD